MLACLLAVVRMTTDVGMMLVRTMVMTVMEVRTTMEAVGVLKMMVMEEVMEEVMMRERRRGRTMVRGEWWEGPCSGKRAAPRSGC